MLEPGHVLDILRAHGVTFFAGVPDSLLKDFCACISHQAMGSRHVIAANEGGAVALAAGHHLATGGLPVVYFQNSGLGNAVNPLLSLADREVYALPMLLVIGWRGEPGVHDEPQHAKQGRVLLAMLGAMEIPYRVLRVAPADAGEDIAWTVERARSGSEPVALVVRKGTFAPFEPKLERSGEMAMSREVAIEEIIAALDPRDVVVSTTGMISRELHDLRLRRGESSRDFLTVGSMGHASSIACAIANARPDRQVFCLDGDGAMLMHMGSIAIQGQITGANFKHIVLNNGCHDSVGGQPTVAFDCDLTAVARACGYTVLDVIREPRRIAATVRSVRECDGPVFVEIRVARGARKDLGRPSLSPRENKEAFVRLLSDDVP